MDKMITLLKMSESSEDLQNAIDWWDYVQCDRPYKIQWTPSCNGWVRARLDSITPWGYRRCGNAFNALSIGEGILQRQKERLKRGYSPC